MLTDERLDELDGRQVRDVMTSPVVTVSTDDSVAKASALMQDRRVGALPVRRHGRLCGIITDRDIVIRACAHQDEMGRTRVGDVMTPELSFVPPDWPLVEAAKLMNRLRVHRLAVIDGDLHLVGILSSDDLPLQLRALLPLRA